MSETGGETNISISTSLNWNFDPVTYLVLPPVRFLNRKLVSQVVAELNRNLFSVPFSHGFTQVRTVPERFRTVQTVTTCPSTDYTHHYRPTDVHPCWFAIPSISLSAVHLPAEFLPAGRPLLTTNPHEAIQSTKKQKFVRFLSFISSFSHSSLQNEQIFNPKSPTAPRILLPSTSSAPSPRSQSPAPFTFGSSHSRSSSKCTGAGYTCQRWCHYPPK